MLIRQTYAVPLVRLRFSDKEDAKTYLCSRYVQDRETCRTTLYGRWIFVEEPDGSTKRWDRKESLNNTGEYRYDRDGAVVSVESVNLTLTDEEMQAEFLLKSEALRLALRFGGIEGDHHRAWVIDQVVRLLAGEEYAAIIAEHCAGDHGPHTYEWDEGIPP